MEAAHAAARKRNAYLAAQYHRLVHRRGKRKAAIAVGHSILVIAYHLLKDPNSFYQDLGSHYFDQRNQQATARRLVRRLEALGNKVTLEQLSVAA